MIENKGCSPYFFIIYIAKYGDILYPYYYIIKCKKASVHALKLKMLAALKGASIFHKP